MMNMLNKEESKQLRKVLVSFSLHGFFFFLIIIYVFFGYQNLAEQTPKLTFCSYVSPPSCRLNQLLEAVPNLLLEAEMKDGEMERPKKV